MIEVWSTFTDFDESSSGIWKAAMTTSATSDHHQMSLAGGGYVQRGSRPEEGATM